MFVLWTFPYVLFSAFLMFVVHRLFEFPVELDDLIAISRESSDDDMIDLTDPNREADFRAGMSPAEFRANQRLRMVRLFEYLRRRFFNGLLMLHYAHTKQSKWKKTGTFESQMQAILIREVIKAGVNFRIYALFATGKLALWILFRFDKWRILPTPSLVDLREVADIDGIHAYQRLTTAVGYLCLSSGGMEQYEKLMMKLCGHVPTI